MLMLGQKDIRSEEKVANNNYTVNSLFNRWIPLGLAQSVRLRVMSV